MLPVGFARPTRETSKTRNLAMTEALAGQGLTASWVAVDDMGIQLSAGQKAALKKAKWQAQHASGKALLSLQNFARALNRCASPAFGWATLCAIIEDDTVLHPDFLAEATATMQSLPCSWRLLHMCPNFLWKRSQGEATPHFHLNASWAGRPIDVDDGAAPTPGSPAARYFRRPTFWSNWERQVQGRSGKRKSSRKRKNSAWDLALGGPTAFIVRRDYASTVAQMLEASLAQVALEDANSTLLAIDTWFKLHYQPKLHFTAREPQLCRELATETWFAHKKGFGSSSWFDGR